MLDDYDVLRPPDLSRERFCEILAAAASPAQAECASMYDAIVDQGVSPAFALALFRQESSFGRAGITPAFDTRGIGNVRTPQNPANGGDIISTPRGNFVRYPSWTAGARDWAQRIRGERYAGAGLDSVATIIPKYAPAGDQDNKPSAYIESVLTFLERETVGATTMPTIIVDTPRPGQAAGSFAAVPRGVILHGSRGGASSLPAEYAGTAAWAATNPDGLCWNATIGEGRYCVHLSAREWGWNARAASRDYLAVEFAQPRLTSPISDLMVATFAAWYTAEVEPVWPGLDAGLHLPMHSELTSGAADGKSDAFLAGSANANNLRRRIMLALNLDQASEDARMEAYYQAHAAELGEKKYAALLSLHYYQGKALICQYGVVTPSGEAIAGNIVDDWETVNAALIAPLLGG